MAELLRGRVALVTGAAGGIGAATARALAEHGAAVLATDVDEPAAKRLADELTAEGLRVLGRHLDVTHPPEVEAAIQQAEEQLGPLDVLANIAGIYDSTTLDRLSLEQWDRVMNVNLKGTLICSQAALKVMRARRRGWIVNIGSLAGQVGGVTASAGYATSKAGVVCLTKSLAKHAAPFNVLVNCINPGVIDTAMPAAFPAGSLQPMIESTPLKRMGQPHEVANVVVFLASDLASFMTGASVDVNGGIYM